MFGACVFCMVDVSCLCEVYVVYVCYVFGLCVVLVMCGVCSVRLVFVYACVLCLYLVYG